ncbi:MAG TPA: bifunctional shikimate kinase/3-dehydroquinate synthase [Solirubrobacteraceae bacterium]|jgi:shikimate kinase/3-dehydroquinate synthase|nr:bifunctional shikimate kinase/3-dehydroquinate synthase [Solirubrobacteraceae bacterium]
MSDAATPKVALIGFMGAGKSTAARVLGPGSADVDTVIEAREGRTVQQIFETEGEGAFRELEERVTLELLDDPALHTLALGGGAILSSRIREALANTRVVWLDIEVDHAWERIGASGGARPLARDSQRFEQLYEVRRPLYEELADVIIPGSRSSAVAKVLAATEGLPHHAGRVIWATTPSGDYPVYVGHGLATEHRFWPQTVGGRQVVVSDYNAGRHYGELFDSALANIRIMPGEQSKTVAHAEIIWTEMARAGVTRTDVVVALGGGVIGDIAGFCAATYQRGMRVVQVPTTLVAQVDSAYGGKTGVDLSEAKNYVGAFHQPAAVIADTATLETLPAEELAAGYAEVVKTALITGGVLWEQVSGGAAANDPDVIARCALVKLRVVAEDEHDTGVRQLLNLGHTVGHAIETATGYARYRHGEAVALGLLAELRLSGADALRDQVEELFADAGLPVTLDHEADLEHVIFATARDKKRVGEGPVPFVLCPAPGRPLFGQIVPPAELRAAIKELYA